jgi:hypothetical protein
MLRKALGVDGRRGDDDLQVGPARQQLLEIAEQKVDVQAALVRLVDDDRVVGVQIFVKPKITSVVPLDIVGEAESFPLIVMLPFVPILLINKIWQITVEYHSLKT